MRRCVIALGIVAIAPLALWASTYFVCGALTFGVRPYYYCIETVRGAVHAERSFNCLRYQPTEVRFVPSFEWEKGDYVGWERAHDVADRLGVMTWRVSYVISEEAETLNPALVVTPADDILISFWVLTGMSTIPFGVLALWLSRRDRATKPSKMLGRPSLYCASHIPLEPFRFGCHG